MLAIIEYNAGNVYSVQLACKRLGVESVITNDHEIIRSADKVIFPGVGNAATAIGFLKSENLDELIVALQQPVLGICLGLQLMCKYSEEGNVEGMGIFDSSVKQFVSTKEKVPHVGWNNIENNVSPLFKNISQNTFVYYVHGFYATICAQTVAETNYVQPFSAALQKDNFYAVQFHPEKSGKVGEQILNNFLNL